ncbi:TlpA disulfide reductase family protein [Mucilaginibacter auburnensis]|nr:TlpA disulfide reductase family protein [Mucilaginibacter auburnensis]
MLKIRYGLLGAMLALCSTIKAQEKNFVFEPQRPKPGETVQITYDPEGTPLEGQKLVKAVVYSYSNYAWKASDVHLHQVGNQYKASVTLDKQCGLVAFKFKGGDSTDTNNEKGYAFMTIDPEHPSVNAPGAYAGWGFLRSQNRGYGIPGYYKNLAISDTAFYYWMNNEISWHSKEAGTKIAVPFSKATYAYQGDVALPRLQRVIAYLTKESGEDNMLRVRQIYLQVLKRKASADSLDAVLLERYPKGSIARLNAYKVFTATRDQDMMQKLSSKFLEEFPTTTNAEFDEQNGVKYGNVYQAAILLSVAKGDYTVLDRYVNQLPLATLINLYYKVIEIPHKRKDIPDEKLLPYAVKLAKRIEEIKNTPQPEGWYLSPEEWSDQCEKYIQNSVLPIHIDILTSTGNYQEALKLAERAEDYTHYKKAFINNNYALLLNKSGQFEKLNDVLIKSIHENQSSPEMIGILKAEYLKHNKDEAGFDDYLNKLKNPVLSAQSSEEIRKIMRNDAVPDWQMMDLNGNLVKFSDLRGKTVVLDFWATWCVPCKESFPGMKLAVERYKNDPNVVFYFVDTEERGNAYKAAVTKYMKENNYPFNVLFDNTPKGSKQNDEVYLKMCKAYTISGIPMKLIIDAKGKLRFLTDGYKGSATALADEIGEMIELAKKTE